MALTMATPSPNSRRLRTPPTPLHGPQYDNYEPYSPRRSKRSTAQSNPYSSLNAERSPNGRFPLTTTPPATVKRARFARAPTQLSSPPSSPVSPVKRQLQHKTPRKHTSTPRKAANGSHSDSDGPSNSLRVTNVDPLTMLPTPSKTPNKKRPAAAVGARILNFQPNNPNDVMPSPRKIRKQLRPQHAGTAGFELYVDDVRMGEADSIHIYTDANARVPEMDESEDNPFVGPRKPAVRPQRRGNKKSAGEREREQRIEEAVQRDEGMTYVFRGRKILRKFEDGNEEDGVSSAGTDLVGTPEQRRLRHQAGAAAQRPLTRSAIKPRLLFPSAEQLQERNREDVEIDEEAVTDIEMPNVQSPVRAHTKKDQVTPVQDRFITLTPPPTKRATRSKGKKAMQESASYSMPEDDPPITSAGLDDSFETSMSSVGGKRKAESDAESPRQTKTAGVKKRASGRSVSQDAGGAKRTRKQVIQSPTSD